MTFEHSGKTLRCLLTAVSLCFAVQAAHPNVASALSEAYAADGADEQMAEVATPGVSDDDQMAGVEGQQDEPDGYVDDTAPTTDQYDSPESVVLPSAASPSDEGASSEPPCADEPTDSEAGPSTSFEGDDGVKDASGTIDEEAEEARQDGPDGGSLGMESGSTENEQPLSSNAPSGGCDNPADSSGEGEEPEDLDEALWNNMYKRVSIEDAVNAALVFASGDGMFVVSPQDGNTTSGTQLLLSDSDNSVNQRFAVEAQGDGTYVIRGLKSDLVLTVNGSDARENSLIVLTRPTGAENQKWFFIRDQITGLYRIYTALDALLFICSASEPDSGVNLLLGTAASEYGLGIKLYRPVPTIADGSYVISNKKDVRFVVDTAGDASTKGDSVCTAWANTSTKQKVTFTWDDRVGYYRLSNASSKLVIECQGGGTTSGTNVRLWTSNDTIAQRWIVVPLADGSFDIRSAKSGLQFAAAGNFIGASTNVAIYDVSTGSSRQWVLTSTNVPTYTGIDAVIAAEHAARTYWNGIYLPAAKTGNLNGTFVLCLKGSNFVIEPKGGKVASGTQLQLYTSNDTINQRFLLKRNSDGTYRITGIKSNLVVSLASGTIKTGLGIVLQKSSGAARQKWTLVRDARTGTVKLVSAANKKFALGLAATAAKGVRLVLKPVASGALFNAYQPVPTVPDGAYVLPNKKDGTYVISSSGSAPAKSANVQLAAMGDTATERLTFVWDARSGYYLIKCDGSEFVLDCKGGGTTSGTSVQLWKANGTPAQLWLVRELSGASGYELRSAKSGLQLGVNQNSMSASANIALYGTSNVAARGWYMRITSEPSDDSATSKRLLIPTAWYEDQLEDYQAYHPKVIAFEEPWNGYRYWMAYTPYPHGDSTYEDPCIAVSNDLVHWVVPEGLTNPIDDLHNDGTSQIYNSDTHLLYNPDTQMLELFWRKKDYDDIYLYRAVSSDGITWFEKEEIQHRHGVALDDALSPVVIYEDGLYRMWYVKDNYGHLCYAESRDCRTWGEERYLVIPYTPSSLFSWHLDIIKTDKGYEALISAFLQRNNLQRMSLWHTVSADGMVGWTTPKLVLAPTTGTQNWDNGGIYRSCLLNLEGIYYVMYSGHSSEGVRGVGLASGSTPTQLARYVAFEGENEHEEVDPPVNGDEPSGLMVA